MVTLLSLTMNRLLLRLRDAALDENEPTAGLLRKCLFLGDSIGSERLQSWAESELEGYNDEENLPVYRLIPAPVISVDSHSGNYWTQGQMINRSEVPANARKYLPESLEFRQPLEELEDISKKDSMRFSTNGLTAATHYWNQQLPWTQQIIQMQYVVSGTTVKGILSKVRTLLVKLIAELTKESPLEELPSKQKVDNLVGVIIHPVQSSIINNITGDNNQVAIGDGNTQNVINQQLEKLKADLQAIREHVAESPHIDSENPKEIVELADDLETAIESPSQSTDEERQSLIRRLREFASRTASTAFQASLSGAAQGIANLATQGFFG